MFKVAFWELKFPYAVDFQIQLFMKVIIDTMLRPQFWIFAIDG